MKQKTVHVYLSSYKGEREKEKKREKERNGGRGKNLSIRLLYIFLISFKLYPLKFNSLFLNVEKPLSGIKKSGTLENMPSHSNEPFAQSDSNLGSY